ncbi:hypothetical protein ACE7GA_25935 [Roseomonas sp. CCTCC AB2023176]|uniref:hypothetical protein n=1 Tax=Roseomonas sp. CCTCC AB2023176 TaxID=3342640 RepID=UPI0035E114DA
MAQLPLPSDAIAGAAEVVVERQGLSGGRWAWRVVRDSRTLLSSSRHYAGAEEAYAVGVQVWKARRVRG